ncbi:cobalamin biosynthesis Mg chelatase CobN [Nocardiopsis mwathae]|uniref:Cobalamin biosynthesis Mg chelatase CobN n=1 Tax=Nocardiopsis mwathae TaxID=1472723 RepID=A0A7W9YMS2_9ACTN|nr:cobalamin biosynthesis Mg chelatase CobN [Nocardiopsis mwathae]
MAKSDNAQRESAAAASADVKVADEGTEESAHDVTEPAGEADGVDAGQGSGTDAPADRNQSSATEPEEPEPEAGGESGAASAPEPEAEPADTEAGHGSRDDTSAATTPNESAGSTDSGDAGDAAASVGSVGSVGSARDDEPDSVAEAPVQSESQQGGVPMSAPKDGSKAVKATPSARKAHLAVSRIEPWSVMKFSFVIALVCFIILFVAVAVTYAILSTLGVFDALTSLLVQLADSGEGEEPMLNPAGWFSPARVLGYTGLIGALNIILITALSTVGAMLYNLSSDLVGGIDVTLTESE